MKKSAEAILKDVELNIEKINLTFSGLIDEYHNPVRFIAQADALIQALRNFTFFLQSKKNGIENFDSWYLPWQELMKNNPYMRFIVEMRNSIVKQGINTAKSHALIVLFTDYKQTLLERRLDIYTTTNEIRSELTKITRKSPWLKHATGEIHRLYIFNYAKKDDLEVVDTLFYCTVFINELFDDFKNFMTAGSVRSELPKVVAPSVDVSDLKITFRMRDGVKVSKEVIRVDRNEDAIKAYRKKYGEVKLKHDIKSHDVMEKIFANIELAQVFRRQFDELLPSLEYHSAATKRWTRVHPVVSSRADKIFFWNNFAEQVAAEKIDKFYFTANTWLVANKKDFDKAIRKGEEISTLPNLKESLVAYYLDSSGKVVVAQSSYKKGKTGKIAFGEVNPKEDSPANNPMFTAIFNTWGIKTKNK
jgi:hypothetical protein